MRVIIHVRDRPYLHCQQGIDLVLLLERPALEWNDVTLTWSDEQLFNRNDAKTQKDIGPWFRVQSVPHLEQDLGAGVSQVAVTSLNRVDQYSNESELLQDTVVVPLGQAARHLGRTSFDSLTRLVNLYNDKGLRKLDGTLVAGVHLGSLDHSH